MLFTTKRYYLDHELLNNDSLFYSHKLERFGSIREIFQLDDIFYALFKEFSVNKNVVYIQQRLLFKEEWSGDGMVSLNAKSYFCWNSADATKNKNERYLGFYFLHKTIKSLLDACFETDKW